MPATPPGARGPDFSVQIVGQAPGSMCPGSRVPDPAQTLGKAPCCALVWVSAAGGPFEVRRSNPPDPGLPQGTPGGQASPFPQKYYLAPLLTGLAPVLQVTQDHGHAGSFWPGVWAAAPGEGELAIGLDTCPPCALTP